MEDTRDYPYNPLSSRYISPFINPEAKNNRQMVEAIDKHVNHQHPLPLEKALKEGKTLLYAKDKKHWGRR